MARLFSRAIFIVFVFCTFDVSAKTAAQTAHAYFDALKQKDYSAAVGFFDPQALSEFRENMAFVNDMPEAMRVDFLKTFFGAEKSLDAVKKMSDRDYFVAFFTTIMSQAEAVGGVNLASLEVLGEVQEGEKISHVVTRNKMAVGEIEMENMEVISLIRDKNEWRVLMTGKFKGFASAMRAAMSRAQTETRMKKIRRKR